MIQTILMIFIINFKEVIAWKHPPPMFIDEFANVHSLNMIVIYIPENISSVWMEWNSNLQRIQKTKTRIKSISYINQAYQNEYLLNDKELHVYIPNEEDLETSIQIFVQIYSNRSRDDHEFWLLDVSFWNAFEDVTKLLGNMPLDLDDDLYFYSFEYNKEKVKIWEFYEIHFSRPRKIFEYGIWNEIDGLSLVPQTKWVRRRDLEGINLRTLTLKYAPYITELIPINEAGDEYEFEGLAADFFYNLQSILNFTYTIMKPADGAWGSLQTDGSWNGMIGELHTQKADLGIRFSNDNISNKISKQRTSLSCSGSGSYSRKKRCNIISTNHHPSVLPALHEESNWIIQLYGIH